MTVIKGKTGGAESPVDERKKENCRCCGVRKVVIYEMCNPCLRDSAVETPDCAHGLGPSLEFQDHPGREKIACRSECIHPHTCTYECIHPCDCMTGHE